MFYIVEIQEQIDGTGAMLTYTASEKNAALSKWHEILRYAAISNVYIHGAMVITNEMKTIAKESYIHESQESAE